MKFSCLLFIHHDVTGIKFVKFCSTTMASFQALFLSFAVGSMILINQDYVDCNVAGSRQADKLSNHQTMAKQRFSHAMFSLLTRFQVDVAYDHDAHVSF